MADAQGVSAACRTILTEEMHSRTLNRIGIVFLITLLAVMLPLVVLNASRDTDSHPIAQPSDTFTATQFIYLPFISHERPCTDPPSGTMMIAGQATVEGRPAQPNVPFALRFQFFDSSPSVPMTVTTRNGGSFCFGPIGTLPSCRGMWYIVSFHDTGELAPTDNYIPWWNHLVMRACESKVYTVSAEIGDMKITTPANDVTATLPITFSWDRHVENEGYSLVATILHLFDLRVVWLWNNCRDYSDARLYGIQSTHNVVHLRV
jgi:hypothetical protein